jgi:DNA-binding transcriptional MerR regulator
MTHTMSSTEAAEHLGVPPSTIKNWAVRLPVPSWVDAEGTRRFPADALAVLETVKRMREDERSYATIRRTIEPAGTAPLGAEGEPARPAPPPERVAETMAVVRPLWNALQCEHATAARRIARLEAKIDDLRADRVALEAEVQALRRRLDALEGPIRPWWRRFFGG